MANKKKLKVTFISNGVNPQDELCKIIAQQLVNDKKFQTLLYTNDREYEAALTILSKKE